MSKTINNKENEEQFYDMKYIILTFGCSSVGKKSLIKKYTKSQIDMELSSIGIDYRSKIIQLEDKKINIEIWYSVGQERYKIIPKRFFTETDGILFIYDITDKDSFQQIISWMDINYDFKSEKLKIILVGNKCDLTNARQVSIEEGQNLANEYNIKFFEVSAKEGTNVDELFSYIVYEIYQENKSKIKDDDKNVLTLKKESSKSKKNNCQ